MRSLLPLLLLAAGCEPPVYGTGPEVFSEPTDHTGDDWVFDHGRINRIDLTIGPDAEEILRSDRALSSPKKEVRADATIDGEAVGDVGVRLRGRLGSFQGYDHKPKWHIDLNEFSGERFHGLEAISLNNASEDCSMVKEPLAYAAYEAVSGISSRTGFAQLYVNGADYGLYVVLETQDDRWLDRLEDQGLIGDEGGNLYDGSYTSASWWPVWVDFGGRRDTLFDLEEGVDIGWADVANISEAVRASEELGHMSPTLELAVDWDQVLAHLVADRWLGNDDCYSTGPNNYRVYFEPGAPMIMAPWDQGGTFHKPPDGSSWLHPGNALGGTCRADAGCAARWDAVRVELAELLVAMDWQGHLDDLVELTREGADGDPRGQCSVAEREQARAALSVWLDEASTKLLVDPEE
jgi:spore coat protein CotH